jgi:hypothetical protein
MTEAKAFGSLKERVPCCKVNFEINEEFGLLANFH